VNTYEVTCYTPSALDTEKHTVKANSYSIEKNTGYAVGGGYSHFYQGSDHNDSSSNVLVASFHGTRSVVKVEEKSLGELVAEEVIKSAPAMLHK
jgi:hypothetical protein